MKEYEVLKNIPPYGLFVAWDKFESIDTKGLRAFGKWFMAEKDNRLQMLFDEIHRDPEFANWNPDFSLDSLKSLSNWFKKKLPETYYTEDEFNTLTEVPPELKRVKAPDNNFFWITPKYHSLNYDVGIYCGEVLLHELGDRQWEQNMKTSKNDLFYGQMIIQFIPVSKYKEVVNPIHLVFRIAVSLYMYHDYRENEIYLIFHKQLKRLQDRLQSVENK